MDVGDTMPSAAMTSSDLQHQGTMPMQNAPGKVMRVPNLKRGRNDDAPLSERVQLERVLGLTVGSNAALACSPAAELVAYPAGCTVVLLHSRKGRQSHLLNTSRKTVTSVAFSADGRYLATGECGHQPSVRVWDLQAEPAPTPVAELAGHKYGVSCVAFSPNHKHVVSVGTQHDMIVNVWDWRAGVKVASNKVSTKVKAVSFADNGSYFVTVGNRHVKFWYLEHSRSAKYKEPVPLMGRSAILGEQRNNYFCDVGCGRGEMGDSTYAITKSGLLCEFNNRRLLDKWVELRTTSANCLAVGERYIVIGCAEGIVRCFDPATLQFVTTLPRTHYLGVDVSQGLTIAHMAAPPKQARYPDAVAITLDEEHGKVTCVYNDHSLYVWDVRDIRRVGKSQSFLYHSACIWGVEMYPELPPSLQGTLPPGSFLTCSSDDTIRVWHLDPSLPVDSQYQRNIYSNELLKVLYIDPELGFLKDLDVSATSEKPDSSYDGRNGVRSIRVSPDGAQLASGDRAGNVRIHDLRSVEEICRIEAHDAEVLCLEYSQPDSGHRLLASASRDRLIHVFNVDQDYNFLQTLDDHSSSITAVRFLQQLGQLGMASCGADKSIIFRQMQPGSPPQFARGHNVAGKTTLYDMEVDAGQKHVLTACQDRNIRVYNVSSGKHSKTFKGSASDDGSLIKVVLDSSGIYLATSCTDKTLSVYDYYSGECLATMLGHSELVTGLRFTNDGRRLVSASGDGCLFVWKLPHDMVVTMQARRSQQAARSKRSMPVLNGHHDEMDSLSGSPTNSLHMHDLHESQQQQQDYRFSVGPLPLWAKKQMQQDAAPNLPPRQMDLPKGRWAQRLDAGGITVKSVYDSDSIIPFPSLQQGLRAESDGSKDSSMEETRNSFSMRRETLVMERNGQQQFSAESLQQITSGQPGGDSAMGKVNFSRGSEMQDRTSSRPLTDESSLGSYRYEEGEDGDVEDYSEGEGESTEPEQSQIPVYYPPFEETNSDYTVNAMDVEELRRSQRRHKKARPERLTDLPSIAVSGSQESDEDDEEASTPSAETAERNLLSLLSVSSESLDRMGQREQFLKNNFESLSGAEQGVGPGGEEGGTSISSQFLTRSGVAPRNVALITAARQTRQDAESVRRREELQRRIEDTRRKLQSVGYRSGLSSSQSITDLSHIPEKDFNTSPMRLQAGYNSSRASQEESSGGGLRRAISLSDLSAPAPRRPNSLHVSGKVSSNSSRPGPGTGTRTLPRPGHKSLGPPPSSGMSRSSSVGVLNQSEDDPLRSRPLAARHTISSQNKMAATQAARERRRAAALSASAGNLQGMQAPGTEDSSSEEAAPTPPMQSSNKPAIAPRPRNIPTSNGPIAPPRGLGRTAREVTQRLAGGGKSRAPAPPPPAPSSRANMEVSPEELPVKDTDMDIATAPITPDLCQQAAEQLTRSAEALATLHKRASVEIEPSERALLLQTLGAAAIQAQRTLRMVAPGTPSMNEAQPASGDMVHMMQQYSDMLVSIVQQRMAKPPPSS